MCGICFKERIYGYIENVFIDSGATNLVLKLYVFFEIFVVPRYFNLNYS